MIIFAILGGFISDRYFNTYYDFAIYTLSFGIIVLLICFTVISISDNITVVSVAQVALSFGGFSDVALIIWVMTWVNMEYNNCSVY